MSSILLLSIGGLVGAVLVFAALIQSGKISEDEERIRIRVRPSPPKLRLV